MNHQKFKIKIRVYSRVREIFYKVFKQPTERQCPICGENTYRFLEFGNPVRHDVKCSTCGSLERHRFTWLLLHEKTDLFNEYEKTVLHVAPERCFEKKFRQLLGRSYITADLINPDVDVKMDITDINYPDDHFDVILCSHVLEHVQDDIKAMSELHRVLHPDGLAILDVPISSDKTYEDPSIVDPEDRLEAFGQEDHVRIYGPDYKDRLEEAGFSVTVITVGELASEKHATTLGITPLSRRNFFCEKGNRSSETH